MSQGRYQRSVDQVYHASVAVIQNNGVVITEYIPHDTTNTVRSLQGKVNERMSGSVLRPWIPTHHPGHRAGPLLGASATDLAHDWKRKSRYNWRGEPYFNPMFCS